MKNTFVKAMLGILSLATVAAISPPAHAVGVINGVRIAEVAVGTTLGWVRFAPVAIGGSRPSCVSGSAWISEFAFDPTTNKGKALLTMLTAAQLAGKRVDAAGAGTCSAMSTGNAENLDYIKIYDN